MSLQFGITKDTKSKNRVPIDVPTLDESGKYVFPVAVLRKVEFVPDYEYKKGKADILRFTFSDVKGEREHTHIEWPFELDNEKAEGKLDMLNQRIKHMYEAFATFPEKAIGAKTKTFGEFYKAVEVAFNTDNEKGPIYKTKEGKYIMFFLKVIWNRGNRNLPYSPNFMERTDGKSKYASTLEINTKYDDVLNKAAAMDFGGSSIGASPTFSDADMPSFDD